MLDTRELFQAGDYRLNDWNHRPPLVLHLRDKADGLEFYLVNVHLARANAKFRLEQAKGLREWACDLVEPAIAIGDFNFDYEFNTGRFQTIAGVPGRGDVKLPVYELNESGQEFIHRTDNIWTWFRHEDVDTNWHDGNNDGVDDYPNSMLDLHFLHIPPGFKPKVRCGVIVRDGDFPDTKTTSDHRPIFLKVDWNQD